MIGVLIYLVMMATAFMGYVLPWGQMSFWGAKVITNLFSAIPVRGRCHHHLAVGRLRGRQPDARTASSRCTTCCPSCWPRLVGLHIWALHVPGNNNPTGVSVKGTQDTLPFHPYYTMKDAFAIVVFLMFFAAWVFFARTIWAMPINYEVANPLLTPAHIVPEWYYLPFYAILRAIPDKLGGVIAMFGSILILFALPWLDTSKVRSGNYRPLFKRLLLDLRRRLHRRSAISGRSRAEGAYVIWSRDPDGLLLRALPGDPAAARTARKPEAAAGVDFRQRCSPRTSPPPCLPSELGDRKMTLLKTLASQLAGPWAARRSSPCGRRPEAGHAT